MWRHIAANLFSVIIVGLIALAGLIGWGQSQYSRAGPLSEPICLEVRPSQRFASLSTDLVERGAVTNARIFRLGADYAGKADNLKAGSFLVPEGASMAEIVDIVTQGGRSTCGTEVVFRVGVTDEEIQVRELDPATNRFETIAEFDPDDGLNATYSEVRDDAGTRFRIALAEGATSWQIVEALKKADFLDGDVEELPAEGSLAPDSYEVRVGDLRGDVLAAMVDRQNTRLAEAWAARAEGLPLETPEEALILASIVEKETGLADERRQVASVFVNRLNQGMRLQTDPTVIYGVTEGRAPLGRGLRQSELRRETPWNTYVIDGLPPTPIANPGLASIEAALNPDETPYIFFVADGTGGHAFAVTLDEHNANVARWREIEAERANQ
ncbi:MAG: endolytic transglycosylase MltG [Pseudomonadota bacterium]